MKEVTAMKRMLCVVLLVLVNFALTGCKEAHEHHIVVIEEKPPTCEETGVSEWSYCDECKEIIKPISYIPELRHTTSDGICRNCGEYIGAAWKTAYYVDEFGDKTNDEYIYTEVKGVFSNTATQDSPLTVQIAVDHDVVSIFLYEYEDSLVKSTSSISYRVKIKNDSDKISFESKKEFGRFLLLTKDRINIRNKEELGQNYYDYFIEAFSSGYESTIILTESDRPTDTYTFKVPSSNFNILFNELP